MTAGNIEKKLDMEIDAFIRQRGIGDSRFETNQVITFDKFLRNKMLLSKAIRKGIPYILFALIEDYAPFSQKEWAYLLGISTKSLRFYKTSPNHRFKPVYSEKIIEMAEVTKAGLGVFGNRNKLRLWLKTPNYALGRLQPIELLSNSYGKELVIAELTGINHGILV